VVRFSHFGWMCRTVRCLLIFPNTTGATSPPPLQTITGKVLTTVDNNFRTLPPLVLPLYDRYGFMIKYLPSPARVIRRVTLRSGKIRNR
jgi:hypothetical protein